MTRYILRFLGIPFITVDTLHYDFGEDVDVEIAGGSGHNFERDVDPPIPGTENDYDSWADRPFGFRRP